MKPKHTPGPWAYDEAYGLIMAGQSEVAACHAGRGGDAKANARLIAAAPALLEAAKNCREWAKLMGGWEGQCWEELECAIAKAEGAES
jgi:hypothetical protein